jgi:surfactin synthase thioesterase subunit
MAYECASILSAMGRAPEHLFVSARRPPHVPDPDTPLRDLSDGEFIEWIGRRYDGIPAPILADADLLALLLPALRADIASLETHPVRRGNVLSCPVTAYGGGDDPRTPRAHLDAWKDTTTNTFRVKVFPGRHFYLTEQRAALLGDITASLAAGAERRQVSA